MNQQLITTNISGVVVLPTFKKHLVASTISSCACFQFFDK